MDTSQIKNGKYYHGNYTEPNEYRGWFCGTFMKSNHPGKTDKLEVKYTEHKCGDAEKPHYHRKMIELIIMLEGKARFQVNDEEFLIQKNNFVFIDRNNIISIQFLEDSKILAIHTPSLTEEESDEVTVN